MPYLASAPYADAAGSSKMPPAAATTVGKQYTPGHSTYPLVNVSERQINNGSDATAASCTTPHHLSSSLRYSHAGGCCGCHASHGSSTSFFNYNNNNNNNNNMCGLSTGARGTSHITSFPSNELQEYISMTSPASDFYYYTPQPFYLESPAPCAAAELYGGYSSHSAGCSANVAVPPVLGSHCYNADIATPSVGGSAAAGTNTPLLSNASVSGSRFPQWYLPRGLYGSSMAAVTGAGAVSSPASAMYGNASVHGYVSPAPVCTSMPLNSIEEDALSCEENFIAAAGGAASPRRAQGLPVPPRLSPQYNSITVGPLTLPPSALGPERALQAAASVQSARYRYAATGPSAEASPASSPAIRPGRPSPFVPYDGRAYGLPICRGISCADAAVAISRSALVADANVNIRGNSQGLCSGVQRQAMLGSTGQRDPTSCAAPSAALQPATTLGSNGVCEQAEEDVPSKPPRDPPGVVIADAAGGASGSDAEVEMVYSAQEKALLVDAHTRLAKLHAKACEERQRSRSAPFLNYAPFTSLSSPPATPTRAGNENANAAGDASRGKRAQLPLAQRQKDIDPRQRLNESAHSAGGETDIQVSPIPHLPGCEDADTARLDDSLLDEMNLSQGHLAEVEADGDTRVVLERVLGVRGVRWRHDPYSRRLLVQPTGSSSAEDEEQRREGGRGERRMSSEKRLHTPPSSGSEPASPGTLPRSRQLHVDAKECKRLTPDESTLPGSESSTLTQPPASANVSQHTQASNDDSAAPPVTRPSARRLPIKKVCVRHFVSGKDGDRSASTGGAVGVLASVVSQLLSTRATVPVMATTTSAKDSTLSKKSSLSADSTLSVSGQGECVSTAAPLRAELPRKENASTGGSLLVPPPRSMQRRHRDANEGGAAFCGTASASTTDAAVSLSSQETAAANTSRMDNRTSGSSSSSSSGNDSGKCAPLTEPALKQGSTSSSLGLVTVSATSGEPLLVSWAWRTRSLQGLPDTAASVTPTHSSIAFDWGHTQVASTADIDTRLLVQLWRGLDTSGCFRDVLEARRRKLGAESNSSTRVVTRNLARRFGNRHGANGEEEGSGRSNRTQQQQSGMLTEAEVTHVYVLRHRHRSSCAVASHRYDYGTEVVVDGDMGVETGVVLLVMTKAEYYQLSPLERRLTNLAPELQQALAASIHRPITAEERQLKDEVQRPLENATLDFVRFLATQPQLFHCCRIECMNFLEVEFQADGQKLYVYYQTTAAVRFLELATYLNHIFHCRIWMKMAKAP
ncbi:hypothetical protein ABL78_7906 [Leptomonas seymouri]|uniref:PSP1 C-terminal domain-containing protein n=1 Tax=Leptomonas seymouri TaxID=5684 RepID=A0A0N1I1B2_LEPSE|nr:hypothetical protein ABL78_7906 [Leptomonas seymouri]|eukprot:KPI83072.1 hypothetical protein ABL78_7906 [Leptomonas seymouri]